MSRALALAVIATLPVVAQAQVVTEMTPDLVRAAIADQKAEGCHKLKAYGPFPSTLGCFTTPYSRVVQAAKAARKVYKPFSEADVTPDLIGPEFHVFAFPQDPFGKGPHPKKISVATIVLLPAKSKDRSAAILPTRSEEITLEYKNLLGATFEGRGLRAVFPLSALTERNDVRIVYDGQYVDKDCIGDETGTDCPARLKLDKVR